MTSATSWMAIKSSEQKNVMNVFYVISKPSLRSALASLDGKSINSRVMRYMLFSSSLSRTLSTLSNSTIVFDDSQICLASTLRLISNASCRFLIAGDNLKFSFIFFSPFVNWDEKCFVGWIEARGDAEIIFYRFRFECDWRLRLLMIFTTRRGSVESNFLDAGSSSTCPG